MTIFGGVVFELLAVAAATNLGAMFTVPVVVVVGEVVIDCVRFRLLFADVVVVDTAVVVVVMDPFRAAGFPPKALVGVVAVC